MQRSPYKYTQNTYDRDSLHHAVYFHFWWYACAQMKRNLHIGLTFAPTCISSHIDSQWTLSFKTEILLYTFEMINLFELYKEGTFKAFEFVILIS